MHGPIVVSRNEGGHRATGAALVNLWEQRRGAFFFLRVPRLVCAKLPSVKHHLKPLIISLAVAASGFAAMAPAMAADGTGTRQRACHWDRQTGRMICQRTQPSGDPAPQPAPAPTPPKSGTP